jgi:hypothetical protein
MGARANIAAAAAARAKPVELVTVFIVVTILYQK